MRTFPRALAVSLVCSLSLAACDLAPEYFRPTTAKIPETFKEAPGWRVAKPSDATVRGKWWMLFNDPVLNALEERVTISNQNLAAAKAAYDQARALVREQRASFFPTIDLSGGASRTDKFGKSTSSVGNDYSVSIGTTWELDLWGRVANSVKQAGALATASEADLRNATLSAQGELALNYVQLRGVEVQKSILDATITAYAEALKITQNRYQAGVVQRSDVLQAETALHNAQASAADQDRQRAILEHAIAVLVGESPSTFTLPATTAVPIVPDVPSVVPSALLERRPDIAGAERRVAAANANIGIERAAYYPTVDLSGSLEYSASRLGSLFSPASSLWSLGLSGVLSVIDFGARSARNDQARAAYEQTVADYRQAVLTAFQQTEDQLAALRVLAIVSARRTQAAASANQAERIAYNQYQAGQIGYADVIVAQTTALSARLAAAQSVTDRQGAAISLIQAIGGGWGS